MWEPVQITLVPEFLGALHGCVLFSYQNFLSFAVGINGPNVLDYHMCGILAVFIVFFPDLSCSQYHNFQIFCLV